MSEPETSLKRRQAMEVPAQSSARFDGASRDDAKVTAALMELAAELRRIPPVDIDAICGVMIDIETALAAGASEHVVLAILHAHAPGQANDCQ